MIIHLHGGPLHDQRREHPESEQYSSFSLDGQQRVEQVYVRRRVNGQAQQASGAAAFDFLLTRRSYVVPKGGQAVAGVADA